MKEYETDKILNEILDYLTYYRVPEENVKYTTQQYITMAIQCAELHKVAFSDKRYLNYGRDVVVCATGPSFDYFYPLENVYYIGVNNAYKSNKIKFDAIFCQDVRTISNGILQKDFIEYRGNDCIKFVGNRQPMTNTANAKDYKIYRYMTENSFNFDIDLTPLPDFCSVIFSAMSYALWTMPKRIFLVGADCSLGHAKSLHTGHDSDATNLIDNWKQMSYYINKIYPDIDIISVNPVGLRGLFKTEVYTEEFLNSDISKIKVKILKNDGSYSPLKIVDKI